MQEKKRGTKQPQGKQETNKIAIVSPQLLIIISDINKLNSPIKEKSGWIDFKKKIRFNDMLKVKEWKKIFYANGNQKQARVFILISNKINFKFKIVSRDKESHYVKEWKV